MSDDNTKNPPTDNIVDLSSARRESKAGSRYATYMKEREKKRQEKERQEQNKRLAEKNKKKTPEEIEQLRIKTEEVRDTVARLNGLMKLVREQQEAKKRRVKFNPTTGEVLIDDM